ncbi:MAG: glucosidase, partial [Myxococcota bacterium]
MTTENARLEAAYASGERWRRWGPYLSERQWGTVREDYGHDGNAWDYFPHDHARSRAYRWGEDGLLGISDDTQLLCFGLALWNGQDAILKERLFGLTNQQGNHGEDCKEQYHYLDSTPTHSYMRALYRYPQAAFPYTDLVTTNAERGYHDPEYELIDTGVFDEDRYFDVEIEYAKASPEDVCIRVSVTNQGPDPAPLRVLPTLWFRNTWSWSEGAPRPTIEPLTDASPKAPGVRASHPSLGTMELFAEDAQRLLFVDNETNHRRLFEGENGSDAVKDGIHDFVVEGRSQAVRTGGPGTKVAADFEVTLGPGATQVFRLRLTRERPPEIFGPTFESIIADRVRDADAFYEGVIPRGPRVTSKSAATLVPGPPVRTAWLRPSTTKSWMP